MDVLIGARSEFDADHVDPMRLRCSRRHGHHFVVEVEKIGDKDDGELERDLFAITQEWQDRSLDELMPGWLGSLTVLSAWINERLLLKHPTIIRVRVDDGRAWGAVRQEPRR